MGRGGAGRGGAGRDVARFVDRAEGASWRDVWAPLSRRVRVLAGVAQRRQSLHPVPALSGGAPGARRCGAVNGAGGGAGWGGAGACFATNPSR